MGFISIDLSEVHQLADNLRQAGDTMRAKAEVVVAAGGHRTVAAAQAIVPVDTGLLKSSISVDVDGLSFEAGPTTDYGIYVEGGTSRMAPEPFMGPAFDQVEGQITDALADAASRIL